MTSRLPNYAVNRMIRTICLARKPLRRLEIVINLTFQLSPL